MDTFWYGLTEVYLENQERIQPVGANRLPIFEYSKMVWNYRELITRTYRIDVRANHYKINPPLIITWTEWTDCTDKQDFFLLFFSIKRNCIKYSQKILTVFQKTVEE